MLDSLRNAGELRHAGLGLCITRDYSWVSDAIKEAFSAEIEHTAAGRLGPKVAPPGTGSVVKVTYLH